jgi:hypothetical protein
MPKIPLPSDANQGIESARVDIHTWEDDAEAIDLKERRYQSENRTRKKNPRRAGTLIRFALDGSKPLM